MTERRRQLIAEDAVPVFAPHVKFRFDDVRERWVVLAPERLLLPDEIAVEILRMVDGQRSVEAIVTNLAQRFEAPREEIAGDVLAMLQDLLDKSILRS